MRDIAQADNSVVSDEVDGEHVLLGLERARDTDEDLFVPGLHHARGGDGVLGLKRRDQRGAIDSEARQRIARETIGPKLDQKIQKKREMLASPTGFEPVLPP